MHEICYSPRALKVLRRIPANLAETIRTKVVQVAADPFAPNNNAKKLQGREGYRLRVGDWRVIYKVEASQLILLVIEIGPRGAIYQ
jgi:mRNA interferase RelE/StbE